MDTHDRSVMWAKLYPIFYFFSVCLESNPPRPFQPAGLL